MEPHILLQMPLFRGITEETLLKFVLLHQHTLKSYKSGEFIAMQGDIYRSLYILCNGTVRTQMVSAEGKQLTIETLRAPKLLAPAFIFASENRFPVNIETLETSEVLILNKDAFLEFMHQYYAEFPEVDFRPELISIQETERVCLTKPEIQITQLCKDAWRYRFPTGSGTYTWGSPSVIGTCHI